MRSFMVLARRTALSIITAFAATMSLAPEANALSNLQDSSAGANTAEQDVEISRADALATAFYVVREARRNSAGLCASAEKCSITGMQVGGSAIVLGSVAVAGTYIAEYFVLDVGKIGSRAFVAGWIVAGGGAAALVIAAVAYTLSPTTPLDRDLDFSILSSQELFDRLLEMKPKYAIAIIRGSPLLTEAFLKSAKKLVRNSVRE